MFLIVLITSDFLLYVLVDYLLANVGLLNISDSVYQISEAEM